MEGYIKIASLFGISQSNLLCEELSVPQRHPRFSVGTSLEQVVTRTRRVFSGSESRWREDLNTQEPPKQPSTPRSRRPSGPSATSPTAGPRASFASSGDPPRRPSFQNGDPPRRPSFQNARHWSEEGGRADAAREEGGYVPRPPTASKVTHGLETGYSVRIDVVFLSALVHWLGHAFQGYSNVALFCGFCYDCLYVES